MEIFSESNPAWDMLPDIKKNQRERPSECSICYRPASGYHCGVITCKACKTFFRRMCVSTSEVPNCISGQLCFDKTRKSRVNIRCQSCRYKQCLKMQMNPAALELTDEEKEIVVMKNSLKNRDLISIDSRDLMAKTTIDKLTYLELKLEIFRLSAYNPVYYEIGGLREMIQCSSRISIAEKCGPMPGWPLNNNPVESKPVTMKSKIRDIPDEQPKFSTDSKVWMLFNTMTTIEYAKTFAFFHSLSQKDQLILTGHVTLICMSLHTTHFAISRKIYGCLQPDGLESPKKDEGHFYMAAKPFAPLIRCAIKYEEYVLLKVICLCNPTIHGLSEHAQIILTRERQKFGDILFDYCQRTRKNGPDRFVELLGIIPVLEQQQQMHKSFYICHLAPILAKYDKIATFVNDIMFS
ncbi:unnamed protein product [Caenorhabditis brenneri]